MSQALYRKYRSRGFDEIVGQKHVTDLLAAAVGDGSISHAYLFTGPRGTGKTSVARILAHQINDLPYSDDSNHLDIIEIDAASNRRIDDIRELRDKVHIAPTSAKYKVYIIDEVHMLTTESFNALLKTLEEPPAHAVFILATTELNKVPATIISRTQRFHFHPGSRASIISHLKNIAQKESISIEDEALELIADHSEGGFRDSVSLLDQTASLATDKITREMVESLLGLVSSQLISQVASNIKDNNGREAISTLQKILTEGTSPAVIVSQLSKELQRSGHDRRLYELLCELIDVPRSHAPALKLLAVVGKHTSTIEQIPTKTAQPKPSTTKPLAVASPKPIVQSAPIVTVNEPAPVRQPVDEPIYNADINTADIHWPEVMFELKKQAPTLYSIVKNASVVIEKDGINLTFSKAFHCKKLQDDKHRKQLSSAVQAVCGGCPPISILEGTRPLGTDAQAVASVMGGGEAVAI